MERIVSELENQLEAALAEIGREENRNTRYDRSLKRVRQTIRELNGYLEANPFPGKPEEIYYFRELAPRLYSQLFYFMKLYQLEAWRPHAGGERFREVLEQELAGVARFYEQHKSVCHYYCQHATYWDDYLFTGWGHGEWAAEEAGLYIGADFTLGSYWVSWILANERLRVWLLENLAALDRPEGKPGERGKLPKLPWKGTTTDLVEAIYAMYLAGSFGKATLREVIEFVAEIFDIEINYVYTLIEQVLNRKRHPTKYIDRMRAGLVRKGEERE